MRTTGATLLSAADTDLDSTPSRALDSTGVVRPHNLLNTAASLAPLLTRTLDNMALLARGASGDGDATACDGPVVYDHVLDAFLLATGICQILEDDLHRDVLHLQKVDSGLQKLHTPLTRPARRVSAIAGRLLAELRGQALPRERRMARWHAHLGAFILELAEHIMGAGDRPSAVQLLDLVARGRAALQPMQQAPRRLRRDVMRLPSCFRSFDQHPDDCRELAARFAARWPDRDVPLLVVGIRTSGSYLAPLLGAALRALGYTRVEAMTMRPKQRWFARERRQVRAIAAAGGRALLVDDPPSTGGSVVRAAQALVLQGLPTDRVSLMLALFGPLSSLPDCLRPYDTICLPFAEWAIHARLRPEAARSALANLLSGRVVRVEDATGAHVQARVAAVAEIERVSLPHIGMADGTSTRRVHARARYVVHIADEAGRRYVMQVYATGIGAGYLGRYAQVTWEALSRYLPESYGICDGILYRAWLPGERRPIDSLPLDPADQVGAAARAAFAHRIGSYVAERWRALAVGEDVVAGLLGRGALWQRGGDLLALAFGRSASLVRPLVYRATGHLLSPSATPSVIDGSMDLDHWFAPGDGPILAEEAVKVAAHNWAFSNRDHSCFDARYDLASAAAKYEHLLAEGPDYVGSEPTVFSRQLRDRFETLTGESVGEERWHLYQLLSLSIGRAEATTEIVRHRARTSQGASQDASQDARDQFGALLRRRDAIATTLSRVHMRYIGDHFFADLSVPTSGPLCAVDIDGVLEAGQLSFTAISPAGALALRALARHGYRPVLATGRSLGDVRARCAAYRLAGGVAEYGAVAYDARAGRTQVLLSARDQERLDALRDALSAMDGVYLDPAYRYAVRAYRLDKTGQRRGLREETIAAALAQVNAGMGETGAENRIANGAGPRVPPPAAPKVLQPVRGMRQTDFIIDGIDKGTGLAALYAMLNGGDPASHPFLAFAAGDTVSDLAMFRHAARAYAPANADAVVYKAAANGDVRVLSRANQAGLLLAVADLVGHDPERCRTCRTPVGSPEARLLLSALGAADATKVGKIVRALHLARLPADRGHADVS